MRSVCTFSQWKTIHNSAIFFAVARTLFQLCLGRWSGWLHAVSIACHTFCHVHYVLAFLLPPRQRKTFIPMKFQFTSFISDGHFSNDFQRLVEKRKLQKLKQTRSWWWRERPSVIQTGIDRDGFFPIKKSETYSTQTLRVLSITSWSIRGAAAETGTVAFLLWCIRSILSF